MDHFQKTAAFGPLQQRYKSFFQLLIVVSTISLGAFYFGYTLAYLNSIEINTLLKIYGIEWNPSTAEGILSGCISIGGGIGALASDILIKRFSRRQYVFVVNSIAFVAGWLIYIQNGYMLIIFRIIQGICVGFYSAITPVIIKQLSPNQISGTLGALNQFFIAFGIFFAFFFKLILQKITNDVNGESFWFIVFGFTLITIVLQTILLQFVFPYQTPKYLLQNSREDEARQLIRVFYKQQFVEQVLEEKKSSLGKNIESPKENSQSVITYQNEKQQTNQTDLLLQKKKPNNKIAVFIALHLALLQQFVGINAVAVYGGKIAGDTYPDLKTTFPALINLVQCLAPLVVSYLLSKVGRKTILQGGTLFGAITTAIIAIGCFIHNSNNNVGNVLIVLGLMLYMANFGLSLGPVVWLYIPEVVEPNIVPYSTGLNWGGASLVILLFPILTDALPNSNPAPIFVFFCAWCVVSFFINAKYTIETKGKTEKQIYEQYEKMPLLF